MNKVLKPALEKVLPEFGSSFSVKQYVEKAGDKLNYKPFWHFHPELELVFINGGNGKRHVGNHLSYFNNGDLVLIGSNLPHYGFTDRLTGNCSETVIQMQKDFLGRDFFQIPEMKVVGQLFERANSGISFYGTTKKEIGKRLEQLPQKNHVKRLVDFIQILHDLALSEEYYLLNAEGYTFEVQQQDNDRADVIYGYVRSHFQRPITLTEIAEKVNMTVPSFCRFFKKLSAGKTFTQFVNEYRIIHACKLLVEETSSITDICFICGFNNFSHFNRSFRQVTGKSPSEYRKNFKRVLESVVPSI
ncbi:MAG: AraC family transcriptional regulator [Saprospiraceae bacterium]